MAFSPEVPQNWEKSRNGATMQGARTRGEEFQVRLAMLVLLKHTILEFFPVWKVYRNLEENIEM